jgi:carboxylesterase type B
VARRLAAQPDQPPVYACHFRWGSVRDDGTSVLPDLWGRRLGSFHSLEIPFFLGTDTVNGVMQVFLFSRKNEPGRRALSGLMMGFIARFIRTGDPNGNGLPEWPAWSNDDGGPKSLVLDADLDRSVVSVSDVEYTRERSEADLRIALGDEAAAPIIVRRGVVGSDFAQQPGP